MNRQRKEFAEMQRLSSAAAPFHGHMMVKMEQMRGWREDAELSRALLVARRQAQRERERARQSLWLRVQAALRPQRQPEPEQC